MAQLLPHYVLIIQLLLITTIMFLGVTSHYYHYYHFKASITTITTILRCPLLPLLQVFDVVMESLLPSYYLIMFWSLYYYQLLLLPVTMVVIQPLLVPINQENNGY